MKSILHCVCAVLCAAALFLPMRARAAEGAHDTGMLTELGASPDQVTRIHAVHTQAAPQIQAAKQALAEARAALRKLVVSADATDEQLQAQYTQVWSSAQALHKLHFDSLLKVRSILTPAQRTQAAALLQQKRYSQHMPHDGGDDSEVP